MGSKRTDRGRRGRGRPLPVVVVETLSKPGPNGRVAYGTVLTESQEYAARPGDCEVCGRRVLRVRDQKRRPIDLDLATRNPEFFTGSATLIHYQTHAPRCAL